MHTYNVQARARGNTQVFASFSPKISTFWLLRVFSLCKILYPVSRLICLLQFYNIATNYLVSAICILKNSCKCCALIIAFFYEGQVISMETKYLWLMFGVHRTQ